MRISLDAKDLINLLERQVPVDIETLGKCLTKSGHELVLCFTNVRELVAPVVLCDDFLRIRGYLQSLEQLPVCYLAESRITPEELKQALECFEGGAEYTACDPYVRRWD